MPGAAVSWSPKAPGGGSGEPGPVFSVPDGVGRVLCSVPATESLFETRENAEVAGAMAEQMRERIVEAFGITEGPTHEIDEVAIQA